MGKQAGKKLKERLEAKMRWCDGTMESGQKMRIFSPPSQTHVSLTLNPWARPGPRWTSKGRTIAAVVMNSPYKALLSNRAGNSGGGGEQRQRERVRNREGVADE